MIDMRSYRRIRPPRALAWLVALVLPLSVLIAAARPAFAVTYLEQAERLQLINAFLLDYRPAAAPRLPEKSLIEIQAELVPLPAIDNRVGAKDEPDNSPPAIPRARVRYLASWGLMLGATAAPAMKVRGFSAPALGGEAGLRFALGVLHGEARAFTLHALVTGPITESGARDQFDVTNSGADLRFGWALGSIMPYAGAGKGHTASTLTVDSDGAQLDADADYQYVFGGLTWYWGPVAFTYEQHRTEDFLDHFILAVSARF
jgi:hypothetical protein